MKKHLTVLLLLACSSLFAQMANNINQPFIEVSSSGDTLVKPDRIYMKIILSEDDSKGRKSVEELEKTMESTLKGLGIDTQKDLSLNTLNSDYKKYFLSGQKVNKTKVYSLLVRDAVTAGRVIISLEEKEISEISIVKKEYSDKEKLLLELKLKAIAKARKDAETTAKAAGSKIGKLLYISRNYEHEGKSYDNYYTLGAQSIEEETMQPITTEFEEIKFESTITVIFSLE